MIKHRVKSTEDVDDAMKPKESFSTPKSRILDLERRFFATNMSQKSAERGGLRAGGY